MSKKKINIAIIGATGYTGLDLVYLLSKHLFTIGEGGECTLVFWRGGGRFHRLNVDGIFQNLSGNHGKRKKEMEVTAYL